MKKKKQKPQKPQKNKFLLAHKTAHECQATINLDTTSQKETKTATLCEK